MKRFSRTPHHLVRRPVVARLRHPLGALLCLLVAALLAVGAAQERYNLLAIDNELVDAAGPYYFIAQGNNSDAFARAAPFAEAMGLELEYDAAGRLLTLRGARTTVRLRATGDIRDGLVKRADAMTVDGAAFPRAVPMAIVVEGSSYVAIGPVVEAFGGDDTWYPDDRLLAVDTARFARTMFGVPEPRVGVHDGFVRVAVDLPDGVRAELAVEPSSEGAGGALVVRFPGSDAAAVERTFERGPLRSLQTAEVDGDAALVLRSAHPLGADGAGYRFDRTDGGTFYVDLGPGLRGEPVATRMAPSDEPLALAPAEPLAKVVVIDAGHGGHDPGAVSRWATEEHVVLAVALELRAMLEAEGIEVVLTRDRDSFLELTERADHASTDRNLFVSIHANAADHSGAQGIETYVFGRPLDPRLIELAIKENGGGELGRARTEEILAAGDDLVRNILRENQLQYSRAFADTVQGHLIDATGARDRGVKENALLVLRNARIPAILVELGFVNNPEEGVRLADAGYQRRLARALADGIVAFLGSGTTNARR